VTFGSVGHLMKDRAQLVVIGAGIVGASAAYHLAELGITDVVVLDQGPLFETGGSTSHAPGLVFQTNGSRTMCRLAQYSVDLYSGLETDGQPAWYGVGGIEVATTHERVEELKRRRGYARAYRIEGTELLTPQETAERIPIPSWGPTSSRLTGSRRGSAWRRRSARKPRRRASSSRVGFA
jgi:dimethylglycine oxidase